MLEEETRFRPPSRRSSTAHLNALFHRVLGGVPFARDDVVLHIFTLFIAHFERRAIGTYKLKFELAESSIQFGVGRVISNRVLVSNRVTYIAKNVRQFSLESRKVGASTGQLCEGVHFIV